MTTPSARSLFLEVVELPPECWPKYLEDACAGDAALRDEVARLLAAHQQVDGFMNQPAVAGTETISQADGQLGTQIGPYQLLEQIGEGGMGVVYVAEQKQPLKRQVALKVIKPGMDTRQVVARFEAERQALALMDHPHIARVIDGGSTDQGRPFFVMELVRGVPITEFCDVEQFTIRQRLELFIQVCQAVQHAHQKGIIHRDLKPSNVLVTYRDEMPIPKVIDFGVAKAVNQTLTDKTLYTQFAQVIGTPVYMSPEQAQQDGRDIDTRSDVYSLGVLLYELLTGTTPFDTETLRAKGLDEFRRIVREDEPVQPSQRISTLKAKAGSTISANRNVDFRRLNQLMRGELDWIALRCLEKDRTRRYQSASEIANDVQRFLNNLPIHARPPSPALRFRKWVRRHPLFAFSSLAGASMILLILGATYWHQRELKAALGVSNELRHAGLIREHALRQQLVASDVQLAWRSALGGNATEARRLLNEHLDGDLPAGARGFAWHYVDHLCREPVRTYAGHEAPLLTAALSPDDRLLASGDRGGEIRIWEVESGQVLKSFRYSHKEVCAILFSPDGQWLATAGQDQRVHVWDTKTWSEVTVLNGHSRTIYSLAWSPDSQWLASGGRDAQITIWNVNTWEAQHQFADGNNEDRAVRAMDWSSDGRLLVAAKGGQEMVVFDTQTWGTMRSLPALDDGKAVLACVFSPDDRYLAYSGYGGMLRVFDLEKERELPPVAGIEQIFSLAFAGSGELIAGGGQRASQVFDVWSEPARLQEVRQSVGESGRLRSVLASRSGEFLITAAEQERVLMRWDMAAFIGRSSTASPHMIHGVIDIPARGAPYSTQDWIVEYDEEQVYVRKLADRQLLATLASYAGWPKPMPAYSSQRNLLASADGPNHIHVWDADTWRAQHEIDVPGGALREMAFSADGERLIVACAAGFVGEWRFSSNSWREVFPTTEGSGHSKLATSTTDSIWAVVPWNAKAVELRLMGEADAYARLAVGSYVNSLRFSPDGKLLAVGDASSAISLWDAQSGRSRGTLRGHTGEIRMTAFSPDGAVLASASADSTIRLWSLATRRELFILKQHERPISVVEFLSPRRLVAIDDLRRQLIDFDASVSPPNGGS